MTNVIPFVARADAAPHTATDPAETGRRTASVISDLVSVVADIRQVSEIVLPLPYDPREVERTIQALLDAISALEHASVILTRGGERIPF